MPYHLYFRGYKDGGFAGSTDVIGYYNMTEDDGYESIFRSWSLGLGAGSPTTETGNNESHKKTSHTRLVSNFFK